MKARVEGFDSWKESERKRSRCASEKAGTSNPTEATRVV